MFLEKNQKTHRSASIAFDRSNANRGMPKALYIKKRENIKLCSLFSVRQYIRRANAI